MYFWKRSVIIVSVHNKIKLLHDSIFGRSFDSGGTVHGLLSQDAR